MMNNPPQPSELETQQTRLLIEFYELLIEIESAFEQTEEVIQTKFAIANNFDLENPDTYLALISPVSRKIKNIANLAKLAHYKLIEYRELESKLISKPLLTEPKYEPQPTSKPLFTQSKQKLNPHQNPEKLSTQKSSHLPYQARIAPEHIMLGILDLSDSIAFQILQELPIDAQLLRSQLVKTMQKLNFASTEVNDTNYQIEQPNFFSETIKIIALPQENGRWACAVKGNSELSTLLIYANTKTQAISLALRQLATLIELESPS